MGLDWRPLPKPKLGFEQRYIEIFNALTGKQKPSLSIWDRIKGKQSVQKEELLAEWRENSILSYETIRAPMVGRFLTFLALTTNPEILFGRFTQRNVEFSIGDCKLIGWPGL